jgi:hypothetical protein
VRSPGLRIISSPVSTPMQEWPENKENLAIEAYLLSKNITSNADNAEPRKTWTAATSKKGCFASIHLSICQPLFQKPVSEASPGLRPRACFQRHAGCKLPEPLTSPFETPTKHVTLLTPSVAVSIFRTLGLPLEQIWNLGQETPTS